jgi:hypothetical protein
MQISHFYLFVNLLWMFTQKHLAAARPGIEPMPLRNGPNADHRLNPLSIHKSPNNKWINSFLLKSNTLVFKSIIELKNPKKEKLIFERYTCILSNKCLTITFLKALKLSSGYKSNQCFLKSKIG